MAEPRFTNREVTLMFQRLEDKLDDNVKHLSKQNETIISLQTYTNGKVKKLYLIVTAVGAVALSNSDQLLDFIKFII